MIRSFAFFLLFWVGLAQADPLPQLERAYLEWLDDVVTTGGLVALQDGEVVGYVDDGFAPDQPVELASLSKAITAMCAATLVEDGKIGWSDTLRGVLGQGPENVSLRSLVTHTSGIWPDSLDGVQGVMSILRGQGARDVAPRILARPRQEDKYRYSNENYALIALIIERVTGAPYAPECRARVLDPVGAEAAEPSGYAASMLPWGGWRMRLEDYGRFAHHWFGPSALGWSGPSVRVGKARYGLGMFIGNGGIVEDFQHFGAHCVPGVLRSGSYVAGFSKEWVVVAAWDACVDGGDMKALRQAIADAIEPS